MKAKPILVALAVSLATAAAAQPPALEPTRPVGIVVSLYRERSGEPRVKVSYRVEYTNGVTEVAQPVRQIYSEQEALAAGYTEAQVRTMLDALELGEASVYAKTGLPTPSPSPVPTPAPTPGPVPGP